MSFLSRKPARPDGRGRGDEYDDFDDYADDGYAQSDDGWSPNQYFSPEGIKGKWAGETPAGRSGGRGQRDAAQDSYGTDFSGGAGAPAYGGDEFETGMYDLPDGTDDRGAPRGSRRSRDREDRGERTGILRLRRDRGEDIWPEEVVSDEDYWASVAADRPFHSDAPLGDGPAPGPRPGSGPRPGPDARPGDGRSGTGPRPGPDGRPGAGGADPRFGGGPGRLGPAPGLASDYKPASAGAPGSMNGSGGFGGPRQPGGSGRTGSGPMPARPGTGPQPVRPGTGPTPTVGVTSSRPPAKPSGARPGPNSSVSASGGFPKQQPQARPSFQPTSSRSGALPTPAPGAQGSGRQQDWGDRTERIERVNASGYPDARPAARSQGPGPASGRRTSGPLGLGAGPASTSGMPGSAPGPVPGSSAAPGAPGRGRGDGAAWRAPDRRETDRQLPDRQMPDRQAADRRAPGRDGGRETSGPWPVTTPARGAAPARGGSDDDPLTSKAYSRAAMSETDGRSYRVAARRSAAQTKLTEQAETFLSDLYQTAKTQQSRGGDYWQYRDDTPAPVPQSPAAQSASGRYPALGGRPAQPGRSQAGPSQPAPGHAGPGQAGPGQVPGRGSQPGFTPANPGRPALPGAGTGPGLGLPSGQYETQQPRPSQQQRPPQRPQPQLPAAGLPAAPPSSGGPAGPAASGQGGARAAGQNPYDSGVTGSYPYASQPYPAARPAPGGPAQDGTADPYYRPSPPAGYPADAYPPPGGASQGRADYDQGRSGYGSGYPATGDRRY